LGCPGFSLVKDFAGAWVTRGEAVSPASVVFHVDWNLQKAMDFTANQGANRSNSELLRGLATQSRRESRAFMLQEE
jgi:hypothetical protein